MNEEYFYIVSDPETAGIGDMPDPQDPFDNPSESHSYQCDYGTIVPDIRIAGFRLPRLPDGKERSRIRRYFNIVGGFLLGHFLLSNVIAVGLIFLVETLVTMVDRAAVGDLPYNYRELMDDYLANSSLLLSLSVLIYGTCNVAVAILGCKLTKIPIPNLFRTKDLTPGRMFGYICAALFLQSIMGLAAYGLTELFDGVGITLFENDMPEPMTVREIVLSFVYSVIVAPITEELLMRGFVQKNLCRTNQRFGIIMTSFIFGIWHENVAQFLLAFVAGCLFGYLAVRHDSLVPCIICHMAVNCFAEVVSFCDNHDLTLATGIIEYVHLVLIVIGFVMVVKMLVVDRFPRATVAQQERGARIALTSPLILLVLIMHIGAMVLFILEESGLT